MKATDILMAEHRIIERVLDSLDTAVERLARGHRVRPGFFLDVADFSTHFADGCHHRKEEGVLFPAMEQHGVPAEDGPIQIMLDEHEEGRAYIRRLRDAARRFESGNEAAVHDLVPAARGYAALLREHIAKEDDMLFPMAAEVIPETSFEEIARGFDRVEHDDAGPHAHTQLLALARRLEEEMSPRLGR